MSRDWVGESGVTANIGSMPSNSNERSRTAGHPFSELAFITGQSSIEVVCWTKSAVSDG
jgi:hypothetical protein